jgi:DNA ligase (NAD+)
MNIEGLGESLIAQVIKAGLVHDYADVYAFTPEKLEQLERMGKKSAAKLMLQIEKSRGNEFWRLIYGLGIRHVGERASQVLARALGRWTPVRRTRSSFSRRPKSDPSWRNRFAAGSTSLATASSSIACAPPA